MILSDEQIQNFKLYGYHITTTNKLKMIKNDGLVPKCGERSKSVGDTREAIYFFPALVLIDNWIKVLYDKKDRASLELLRISLKGLDFTMTDMVGSGNIFGDWYTMNKVLPEKIEFLRRIDSDGNQFLLEELLRKRGDSLIWQPVESFDYNKMYIK